MSNLRSKISLEANYIFTCYDFRRLGFGTMVFGTFVAAEIRQVQHICGIVWLEAIVVFANVFESIGHHAVEDQAREQIMG